MPAVTDHSPTAAHDTRAVQALFTVLFVCTGNVCRSPMAQRLFRLRVGQSLPITTSSAGTRALVAHPMDATTALTLRELGANPDGHYSRQLDNELIASADLILTAARVHRAAVLTADPSSIRRTFTFREFARLGHPPGPAGALPTADAWMPGALRDRVAEIAGQRGLAGAIDPTSDDIRDPFGASLPVMRQCAIELLTAIDAVLAALGLADLNAAANREPSSRLAHADTQRTAAGG